jgi:hypothetical protein
MRWSFRTLVIAAAAVAVGFVCCSQSASAQYRASYTDVSRHIASTAASWLAYPCMNAAQKADGIAALNTYVDPILSNGATGWPKGWPYELERPLTQGQRQNLINQIRADQRLIDSKPPCPPLA